VPGDRREEETVALEPTLAATNYILVVARDKRLQVYPEVAAEVVAMPEGNNVKAGAAAEAAAAEMAVMRAIPATPEAQVTHQLQTVFLFPQGVTLSRCPPEEL